MSQALWFLFGLTFLLNNSNHLTVFNNRNNHNSNEIQNVKYNIISIYFVVNSCMKA